METNIENSYNVATSNLVSPVKIHRWTFFQMGEVLFFDILDHLLLISEVFDS